VFAFDLIQCCLLASNFTESTIRSA